MALKFRHVEPFLPPKGQPIVTTPSNSTSAARPASSRPSTGGVEVIHAHAQLSERRREPRYDCEDEGTLILMQDGQTIQCRLLDQSSGGARIMHARMEPLNGDMWLIRKGQPNVCRASPAWTMPHRMGLRFTLILKLSTDAPCPPKVPAAVHAQWMALNAPAPAANDASDESNTFFID
jgi:hypothetical protein